MARPGLTSHRKFRRLARALSSSMLARGALELIWETCYEAGNDYLGTAHDIETLVGWTGGTGELAIALMDAGAPEGVGFIEVVTEAADQSRTTFRVHDLWHHAPDYVQKRYKRELERRQKVAPTAKRRRVAPNGGQRPPSLDKQTVVDRTPSPAPSPAHAHSPSPSPESAPSQGEGREARLAPRPPTPADLANAWNELTFKPIPRCSELSDARKTAARARLRERPLEAWRAVILRIQASAFCRGESDRGDWKASFDWLLKPDTAVRVLEGKYDDGPERLGVSNGSRTGDTMDAARESLERRLGRIQAEDDDARGQAGTSRVGSESPPSDLALVERTSRKALG